MERIFKAMGREQKPGPLSFFEAYAERRGVPCERCGGMVYAGDWPWCGVGGAEDHKR